MKNIGHLILDEPTLSLKEKKVGQGIWIGGCMRSGTTIMGTLMGSLKEVEYFFEPAFLHKFLYKIGEIPPQIWKELFEAFLYDEMLLNGLAGRNLNFNPHDGSHIHRRKSVAEIAPRLERSYGRLELEAIAKSYVPSFKLPDLIFITPWLRNWYPGIKLLYLFRNPNDVLNSLVRKGWNSDRQLHISSPSPLRDFEVVGNMRIPKWVRKEDQAKWIDSSDLERCAYYYIRINQTLIEEIDHCQVVNYDGFVRYPQDTLDWLCQTWNLLPGDKTADILQSIRVQSSHKEDLLSKLSQSTQAKLLGITSFMRSYSKDNYFK